MRFLPSLLLVASALSAQPKPQAEPGSELTISLLTMEHGTNVWELFGHNAILIEDKSAGTSIAYNWGVFSFRQPHSILRFLKGEMLYAMDGYTLEETILQYRYFNRTLTAQVLNLTPAQKQFIKTFIEWNHRPENINYRYDYFRDNCSTRVRDILDRALGGQIRTASATKLTGTSYRWHATRLMQGGKPLVTGVDIGLGEPSDREISLWEEMFLPVKLRNFARTLQVSDGHGGTQPLVASERVLYQADRPPEPAQRPRLWLPLLVIGIGVAGLFAWLGVRAESGSRGARLMAAIGVSVWSTAVGLLGIILTLLWAVTDHYFAHRNENLLLFNPLWLILAVLGPLSLARGAASRPARIVGLTVAVLALCTVLLHLTTLSSQRNWAEIGLGLPPALAIAWLFRNATRPASAPAVRAR
jgi:hypothetical protein